MGIYNSKLPFLENNFFKNIQLEQFDIDKIKAKVFEAKHKVMSRCTFCGKEIPKGKEFCEWCSRKKDEDKDKKFPYPFISKPPRDSDKKGSLKPVKIIWSDE
ncbi:MAG: hypothetical protein ACFFKA_02225 [Candidatus Thorarchaeota archaeon]